MPFGLVRLSLSDVFLNGVPFSTEAEMATINSRGFIDRLIAGNGRDDPEEAPDNPWATKIVEYTNANGVVTWGVVFEGEDQYRYELESQFVRNPRVIWRRVAARPVSDDDLDV